MKNTRRGEQILTKITLAKVAHTVKHDKNTLSLFELRNQAFQRVKFSREPLLPKFISSLSEAYHPDRGDKLLSFFIPSFICKHMYSTSVHLDFCNILLFSFYSLLYNLNDFLLSIYILEGLQVSSYPSVFSVLNSVYLTLSLLY